MSKRKSPEEPGCNLGKMQERYFSSEKGRVREIFHSARSASEMAYEFLSDSLGAGRIGPDSSYCLNITWETKKILQLKYDDISIVVSKVEMDGSGYIEHFFLLIRENPFTYCVDPSYRQFVPEAQRQLSPRVLIFPVLNEEFVREVLRKCNIPEEYHISWVEAFFPGYQPENINPI